MRAGKIHPAVCENCGQAYFVEKNKLAKTRWCSRACRAAPDYRINKNGLNGCWLWTGTNDGGAGYGRINGKKTHNVVYEREVGPIPQGLELDHLCRNPACCNPKHLEPVTRKVNVERQPRVILARAAKTCRHGHPWNEANTYWHPRSGSRVCRICTGIAQAKYTSKRSA
jgi:hypothetical protein